MQFKHDKLKGLIREKGYTQEEVARHIGIAPSTLSIKLNESVFFGQDEIQKIADLLKIPDSQYKQYFFTIKV